MSCSHWVINLYWQKRQDLECLPDVGLCILVAAQICPKLGHLDNCHVSSEIAPVLLAYFPPTIRPIYGPPLPLLLGRRPNGFLGLSLNDRTIIFLVILLDKTVSVG